jgi:hypothetical protein
MTAQDPLAVLLDQAGVHRDSVVRVTGSSGLSALLWLCRHGYEKVGYLKPGRGCPHESADCLMIARTCDPITLSQLLAQGPHVREGGVLVFRSPLPSTMDVDDPIHRLLAAQGYDVERCVHGAHRELHIARRRPLFRRAAA